MLVRLLQNKILRLFDMIEKYQNTLFFEHSIQNVFSIKGTRKAFPNEEGDEI